MLFFFIQPQCVGDGIGRLGDFRIKFVTQIMDDMDQIHTVIELMVIDPQPVHRPCQCLDHPFGLGTVWPAGNGLKGGILTKCVEPLIEHNLIILGAGLIHHSPHIIKPDLPRYAASMVEGIVQTLKQGVLMAIKGQCDVFLAGKRQDV